MRQGGINIKIDIFINETEESVKMNPHMYSQVIFEKENNSKTVFSKNDKRVIRYPYLKKWTSTHMSHHTQKLIWNES